MAKFLPDDEVKVLSAGMVPPGESISGAQKRLLAWADIVLPYCAVSESKAASTILGMRPGHLDSDLEKSIWRALSQGGLRAIPVIEGKKDPLVFAWSLAFRDLAPAVIRGVSGWELLREAIERLGGLNRLEKGGVRDISEPLPSPDPAFEIKSLELRNVGCFRHLVLKDLGSWVTVLGDNAAGKSTLLRAIALGLCDESDATVLLKQLPGPLRREAAKTASIRIELSAVGVSDEAWIETILGVGRAGQFVRKKTKPDPFPWERIFACGYGTGRSRQATSPSRDAYAALDALRLLFDDKADLQNPEVVLQRQENGQRRQLEERLMSILMLDEVDASGLTYGSAGVTVRGPWGDRPFRVLSDGYRSTSQWVLDFCAWAIYAGRLDERSEIGGILLIDEIEQHLHPRWQREFVQRLRKQFPKTQIFTTTHTPLVASGVADLAEAQLVRLKLEQDGTVEARFIEPQSLDGMRADQVLTSEAFGLVTSRNLGSDRKIDQYTALLGQDTRTAAEEAKMAELAAELEDELRSGETQAEREVERVVEEALKSLVTPVKPEVLEVEAKRQLRQLFSGDKSEAD